MKNYTNIDNYYNELVQDIYPQPLDDLHKKWTEEIVEKVCTFLPECKSVLDVGCGEAYSQQLFENYGVNYWGICLGEDYETAKSLGRNVSKIDFNFLSYWVDPVDLIFARHSLEHSPFPILTLMEWHSKAKHLCLVMPNPDHFSYIGRNHYSVAYPQQIRWWLRRAGWRILWRQVTEQEYRFICKNENRVGSEGWAEEPLSNNVYEDDRDNR